MTDRRPGPHRIDVHAHYLSPAYKEALHEAEMWLIGGIPVPDWTPELALEFMGSHGIAVHMLSVSDPASSSWTLSERRRSPANATTTQRRWCTNTPVGSERSRSFQ